MNILLSFPSADGPMRRRVVRGDGTGAAVVKCANGCGKRITSGRYCSPFCEAVDAIATQTVTEVHDHRCQCQTCRVAKACEGV